MEHVTDERGNRHYIQKKVGEDGQGELYTTKNSDIILRINEDEPLICDNINFLPISDVDKLILPVDYFENGYVLNIPDGFIPLSFAMNEPSALTLKKRLGILTEISKVLTKLHSLPVMYGSMSPARIFISSKPSSGDAALLYSSKMDFAMRFIKESDADLYIAPESKLGQGGTTASDSYTFGALATDLLDGATLTPELTKMLKRTQIDPKNRPKLSDLCKMFMQQFDSIVTCKKCKDDFYFDVTECPGCKSPPPRILKATLYDKVAGATTQRGQKILEFASHRQCFFNYHTDNVLLDSQVIPRIDCMVNVSADRKLHLIFKNLMDKDITVNEKLVESGQASVVALPCELIQISFPLFSETKRYIDMVMV